MSATARLVAIVLGIVVAVWFMTVLGRGHDDERACFMLSESPVPPVGMVVIYDEWLQPIYVEAAGQWLGPWRRGAVE